MRYTETCRINGERRVERERQIPDIIGESFVFRSQNEDVSKKTYGQPSFSYLVPQMQGTPKRRPFMAFVQIQIRLYSVNYTMPENIYKMELFSTGTKICHLLLLSS